MQNKKGFTLIELLIVVVIIGILAAIAIPKFANTKEKAYVAAMKSDLRNLITAQEAYFSDYNSTYAASTGAMNHDSHGCANHHRAAITATSSPSWSSNGVHSAPRNSCRAV